MTTPLFNDYSRFVGTLFAPGGEVLSRLSPAHLELLHATLGISGEAGEVVDAVKKSIFYNKPLDIENIVEELGDILFYVQALATLVGSDLETVITANHTKLNKRYPGGKFSHQAAQARADKA